MRIALDSIIFGLQRLGGITSYWIELARGLAAHEELAVVLLQPRTMISARSEEVATLRLPTIVNRSPNQLARYARMPTIPGSEVQHSSYFRLPASGRVASVITVYDFTYERYGRGWRGTIHNLQKRKAVEGADAVLCISNHTRNDLLTIWPEVPAAKVITVPLAVDHSRWIPLERGEQAVGLDDLVLFVGRRCGYKRFDLAVEAIGAVRELRLGIVGQQLTLDEEQVLERRLGKRVEFFGEVDDRTLRLLYGSAHALIYPSDHEGFGLPLLEAMACGCPVVAAHKSSLPEVGGDAARWVRTQSADGYAAELTALGDSETRASSVRAGLAQASRFSWASTVDQTLAVYKTLV